VNDELSLLDRFLVSKFIYGTAVALITLALRKRPGARHSAKLRSRSLLALACILVAMNIGLFGGTFDPIHLGHTALASAAGQAFALKQIHFIPASMPPHKQRQPITPFSHRFAMVALATANQKTFVPSAIEAPPEEDRKSTPNYTIQTVRQFQKKLKKSDRLFFLIGIDAFRDIAKWHEAERLFGECEFIVASRPGYSLADVANSLPESLRPNATITKPFQKQPAKGDLILAGVNVHLLESVHSEVSATKIRAAVATGKSLTRYVDPAVAEYIKKTGLYK
jgi:nicotinate-nucleotide adenylyltransferase